MSKVMTSGFPRDVGRHAPKAVDDDYEAHPPGEYDDDDDDDEDAFCHIDFDDTDGRISPLPPRAPQMPTVMHVAPGAPVAPAAPVEEVAAGGVPDADAGIHPAAEEAAYRALVGDPDEAPVMTKPLAAPARPVPTVMHSDRVPTEPARARPGLMSNQIGGKLPFPRS